MGIIGNRCIDSAQKVPSMQRGMGVNDRVSPVAWEEKSAITRIVTVRDGGCQRDSHGMSAIAAVLPPLASRSTITYSS
jgi:hypothetical protein